MHVSYRAVLPRVVIAAAVMMLPAGLACAAASITVIGPLPGGEEELGTAWGVSADGSVVVGRSLYFSSSARDGQAFRWTSATGKVGLGHLPAPFDFDSFARGVSADGAVVVGNAEAAFAGSLAFRWTSAGGMASLGDLPGGINRSAAYATSDDGSVVVGFGSVVSGTEAFRWTAAGGMVGIGELPGGTADAVALGVNADGSVVVGESATAIAREPFRWTAASGMVGLGGFAGVAVPVGEAVDVSADGSVVVGTSRTLAGRRHAFRWTASSGMVSIGELPGGTDRSEARAVSRDGRVVVGESETAVGGEAFVWTADTGMRRLWDVLADNGYDPGANGWLELSSIRDISPDGTIVAGYGFRQDRTAASFVAVVPEPASLAVVALATGIMRRRRRA